MAVVPSRPCVQKDIQKTVIKDRRAWLQRASSAARMANIQTRSCSQELESRLEFEKGKKKQEEFPVRSGEEMDQFCFPTEPHAFELVQDSSKTLPRLCKCSTWITRCRKTRSECSSWRRNEMIGLRSSRKRQYAKGLWNHFFGCSSSR